MIKIRVNLQERSYPILISCRNLDKIGIEIKKYVKGKKIMIVTDSNVNKLYGKGIKRHLKENGFLLNLIVIPAGEKYKNIEQLKRIYTACIKSKLHRDSCIISLGGGVISDLAGFVAATYMRGIALINIPTTLIGQVDAAIGGKTGINLEAKNIVGSFHQPKAVFIDIELLKTLAEKEMKNGLAEIIKYAVIKDANLFRFLEANKEKIDELDRKSLLKIISKCCIIKSRITEKDERENNIRAILNYGHTIGHAIEKASDYKINHGEGVAFGMITEARIARMLGLLKEGEENRIMKLIEKYDLTNNIQLKERSILKAVGLDKKIANEKIRFVLPTGIGRVRVTNVPIETIKKALSF